MLWRNDDGVPVDLYKTNRGTLRSLVWDTSLWCVQEFGLKVKQKQPFCGILPCATEGFFPPERSVS